MAYWIHAFGLKSDSSCSIFLLQSVIGNQTTKQRKSLTAHWINFVTLISITSQVTYATIVPWEGEWETASKDTLGDASGMTISEICVSNVTMTLACNSPWHQSSATVSIKGHLQYTSVHISIFVGRRHDQVCPKHGSEIQCLVPFLRESWLDG